MALHESALAPDSKKSFARNHKVSFNSRHFFRRSFLAHSDVVPNTGRAIIESSSAKPKPRITKQTGAEPGCGSAKCHAPRQEEKERRHRRHAEQAYVRAGPQFWSGERQYAASTDVHSREIRTRLAGQHHRLLVLHLGGDPGWTGHALEFRSGIGARSRRLRTLLLAHLRRRSVGDFFHRGDCPRDHARGPALLHPGQGRLFPPNRLRDIPRLRHQNGFWRERL